MVKRANSAVPSVPAAWLGSGWRRSRGRRSVVASYVRSAWRKRVARRVVGKGMQITLVSPDNSTAPATRFGTLCGLSARNRLYRDGEIALTRSRFVG